MSGYFAIVRTIGKAIGVTHANFQIRGVADCSFGKRSGGGFGDGWEGWLAVEMWAGASADRRASGRVGHEGRKGATAGAGE